MNFQFNVKTNDQDYLDYNMFWILRSPYGKKQTRLYRIAFTVFICACMIICLLLGDFTAEAFIGIIPLAILLVLAQVLLPKFALWAMKGQIKMMKKSGKMGYSPESLIVFSEETFSEITPENKIEQKYSVIEHISVVDNKTMYIHVNNIMAYILPLSCFESLEQYNSFMEFIKTKCNQINFY